jgi:RNA polymerase sigma-70 factor (ECF subfamily)
MNALAFDSPVDSDRALAARARGGENDAFVVLFGRFKNRIYRLALRLSRNPSDAEEIAQEAFVRAYKNLRAFRGNSEFGTWLYRITVNEALMRVREFKRRPAESIETALPNLGDLGYVPAASGVDEGADTLIDERNLALCVRLALSQLDESRRAALVLRDVEGFTAEEAGRILGVSPEVVRQRAHRARLELRKYLAPWLGPAPVAGTRQDGTSSAPPGRGRNGRNLDARPRLCRGVVET